jgi:hypothetical protein
MHTFWGLQVPLQTKALWVEDLDNNFTRVQSDIAATGAKTLCIRTTASTLPARLPTFKQQGLTVYGWRWPHLFPDPKLHHDAAYWPNELNTVSNLVTAGLDGYIFDIESDDGHPPAPKDWDNPQIHDRAQQATTFANGIKSAFAASGRPYRLGLTSHQYGFSNYPGIPWQSFLNVCHALYPQTYWRYRDSSNICTIEAHDYTIHPPLPKGTPDQALHNCFTDYANKKNSAGNVLPIIPMAGEIGCIHDGEITQFGALISQRGLSEAHFYVSVDPANMTSLQVLAEIDSL